MYPSLLTNLMVMYVLRKLDRATHPLTKIMYLLHRAGQSLTTPTGSRRGYKTLYTGGGVAEKGGGFLAFARIFVLLRVSPCLLVSQILPLSFKLPYSNHCSHEGQERYTIAG